MFIFRTRRWRLQRVVREQIGLERWRYMVTLSNGAFLATGFHRWLLLAWLQAHAKALSSTLSLGGRLV
jgi:hypothetical protein